MNLTLHRGRGQIGETVTYWSVYRQVWVKRADWVSDRELAAMDAADRRKVVNHLRHHMRHARVMKHMEQA